MRSLKTVWWTSEPWKWLTCGIQHQHGGWQLPWMLWSGRGSPPAGSEAQARFLGARISVERDAASVCSMVLSAGSRGIPFTSHLSFCCRGLPSESEFFSLLSHLSLWCAAFCSMLGVICFLFPWPDSQLLLSVWFILIEWVSIGHGWWSVQEQKRGGITVSWLLCNLKSQGGNL